MQEEKQYFPRFILENACLGMDLTLIPFKKEKFYSCYVTGCHFLEYIYVHSLNLNEICGKEPPCTCHCHLFQKLLQAKLLPSFSYFGHGKRAAAAHSLLSLCGTSLGFVSYTTTPTPQKSLHSLVGDWCSPCPKCEVKN